MKALKQRSRFQVDDKVVVPRAILFDMDDTILSDDAVSEQAWQETCVFFMDRLQPVAAEELFLVINNERITFWNNPENLRNGAWRDLFQSRLFIVKTALNKLGIEDNGLAREIVLTYGKLKAKMVRLFPNTERTLSSLQAHNIRLALLTNGEAESQRAKIESIGLGMHFPVCLIEGELGFGKPDPRIFRLALQKLNVSPEHAWMVGDRLEFDIFGAKNLGIFTVWCDYSRRGLPPASEIIPDETIYDISELLTLVENKELSVGG